MVDICRKERFQESAPGVAPARLIRDDYRALESSGTMRTNSDIAQLILIQTVEGHAHSGYGPFHGKEYSNTTMDDISRALLLSPREVKLGRQCLIDDINRYAERVLGGEKLSSPVNEDQEPLLGIGFFRNLDVNPHGVLQGLYIGGMRDMFEIRKEAQEKYHAPMGYGKCYPVRREVMNSMGLNGAALAREPHKEEISRFRQSGMIAKNTDEEDVSSMFILHEAGPGASDDAGIVLPGKFFGLSAAVGSFLADAIDTLEKYTISDDDQDVDLSQKIADSGYDLGVSRRDLVDITYLANILPDAEIYVPDSSLQELLLVDQMIDQCPLESHLLYVQNKPYACQDLGRGKTTNMDFYSYLAKRIEDYNNRQ